MLATYDPQLREDAAAALRSLVHRCSIVCGTPGVSEFDRTLARSTAREATARLQRQARQYARAGEPQQFSRVASSTVPAGREEFGDAVWAQQQTAWCQRRLTSAKK